MVFALFVDRARELNAQSLGDGINEATTTGVFVVMPLWGGTAAENR